MALIVLVSPATADERAEFQSAVARAALHYDAAMERLDAQDTGGATAELQRMRSAWQALVDRFGSKRPAAFAHDADYAAILVDVDVRLVGALIVTGIGRPAAARESLRPIGGMLLRLRAQGQSPQH